MGEKRFIRLTDISAYYTKEVIENQIEKGIQRETSRSENRTPRVFFLPAHEKEAGSLFSGFQNKLGFI